jgi:hypothetical protein
MVMHFFEENGLKLEERSSMEHAFDMCESFSLVKVTTPYRTSINDSIENEKNECAIMMMMGE